MLTEDACAVEVDIIVNAGTRTQCRSFRHYVGHLHHTVLSATVLHTDPRIRH